DLLTKDCKNTEDDIVLDQRHMDEGARAGKLHGGDCDWHAMAVWLLGRVVGDVDDPPAKYRLAHKCCAIQHKCSVGHVDAICLGNIAPRPREPPCRHRSTARQMRLRTIATPCPRSRRIPARDLR